MAVALVIAAVWGLLVWAVARWVFGAGDPSGIAFTAGCVLLGTQLGERLWGRRRRATR
ncbi:hypothetical protein ACIRF8_32310 [Streptomyces sp. NPDC102406]|uniref:hypothetical protein n=1 Tax=Streptomyces sp. NPDC102406 TaxID=3366171 RepID=UPI0037F5FBA6